MILAANLKVNHTRTEIKEYTKSLETSLTSKKTKNEVLVFPNISGLDNYKVNNFTVGAQNAYPTKSGAYTGEICLEQLEHFDINTILIGHSERRVLLKESNDFIKQKFEFYKSKGFKIVFCIGESLDIREEGISKIKDFLYSQLDGIDLGYDNLIVAYEPIWSIGSGKTASVEQINETLDIIRTKFSSSLLYGGSVKATNIKEITDIKNCDGVLIGGASNEVKNFIEMIELI
ncbi:MAG: Triosephosphate isomerase (EC [uncultured Campylobacterales bacterium]|uniref:Triosephosphate isomerase n=1 Tax=uncultured Campylobacterales bacterium TaxID=352960 RepID=A0A6S6T1E7_9BACT|nr:MAG: Triosephosphate isomerase (EC [uncultured Campylobacterales bacterium]